MITVLMKSFLTLDTLNFLYCMLVVLLPDPGVYVPNGTVDDLFSEFIELLLNEVLADLSLFNRLFKGVICENGGCRRCNTPVGTASPSSFGSMSRLRRWGLTRLTHALLDSGVWVLWRVRREWIDRALDLRLTNTVYLIKDWLIFLDVIFLLNGRLQLRGRMVKSYSSDPSLLLRSSTPGWCMNYTHTCRDTLVYRFIDPSLEQLLQRVFLETFLDHITAKILKKLKLLES